MTNNSYPARAVHASVAARWARTAALLLAAAVQLCGCALFHKPSVTLPPGDGDVVIPLGSADSMLVVRVRIDDKDAGWWLIDTGAQISFIDPDVAARARARAAGTVSLMNAGRNRDVPTTGRLELAFGEAAASLPRLARIDLAPLRSATRVDVGGILGCDALGCLPFTVDYPRRTLTLHRDRARLPVDGAAAVPLHEASPSPVARCRLADRREWLILDTGYGGGVQLEPHLYEGLKSRIEPAATARAVEDRVGVFGSGRVRRVGRLDVQADGVPIGPLAAEVRVEDDLSLEQSIARAVSGAMSTAGCSSGVLGLGTMPWLRWTFDLAGHRAWVQDRGAEHRTAWSDRPGGANAADLVGNRLLHRIAAVGRDAECDAIPALVRAGADVNARNDRFATPLIVATQEGRPTAMRKLLSAEADVNAADASGVTALCTAAGNADPEAARRLIDAGADVNAANHKGATPLMYAAGSGSLEIVELLLNVGARTDSRDEFGWTPLAHAAKGGNAGIVRRLLKAGARPDARDEHGFTPLMRAAGHGCLHAMAALLRAGADTSCRTDEGNTAVTLIAGIGNGRTAAKGVAMLAACGADLRAQNRWDESALRMAVATGGGPRSHAARLRVVLALAWGDPVADDLMQRAKAVLNDPDHWFIVPDVPHRVRPEAAAELLALAAACVEYAQGDADETLAILVKAVAATGNRAAAPHMISLLERLRRDGRRGDLIDLALVAAIELTGRTRADFGIDLPPRGPVPGRASYPFDANVPKGRGSAAARELLAWWKDAQGKPPYRDAPPMVLPHQPASLCRKIADHARSNRLGWN